MKHQRYFCGEIFHGRTSRKFCCQACANKYNSLWKVSYGKGIRDKGY